MGSSRIDSPLQPTRRGRRGALAGSVGDSFEDPQMESSSGLYKSGFSRLEGTRCGVGDVELVTH